MVVEITQTGAGEERYSLPVNFFGVVWNREGLCEICTDGMNIHLWMVPRQRRGGLKQMFA